MGDMPLELETDMHCRAIMVLMHLLNLEEVTFNSDDVRAAAGGEDSMNLRMFFDTEKATLTLRMEQVLE